MLDDFIGVKNWDLLDGLNFGAELVSRETLLLAKQSRWLSMKYHAFR